MLLRAIRNRALVCGIMGSVCVGMLAPCLSARQPAEKTTATPGAAAAQPEEKVAPEAKRVLDRMRSHYAKVSSVSITPSIVTVMKMGGQEAKIEDKVDVAAARPNLVAVRAPGGGDADVEMATISDGKSLTMFFGAPLNKYEVSDAPKSFGPI